MTNTITDDAQIAEAAFYIWLEEGQPEGRAQEHWHQAVAALTATAKPAKRKTTRTKVAAKPAAKPATRAKTKPKAAAAAKAPAKAKTAAKPRKTKASTEA